MYKIAVCDDQEELLTLISNHLHVYCEKHMICIELNLFNDSVLLLDEIEEDKTYDAYVLDVIMPSCSGMELAKIIKEKAPYTPVILVTAYEQYAVKACGMNLCGYVLKDGITENLESALKRLFLQLSQLEKEKIYIISNHRKYIKLLQPNIIYVYKKQQNAIFVMENGEEKQERFSLRNVYEKMSNPDMYMLDRCIILNLRRIEKIGTNGILMENGQLIYSSTSRITELKKHLSLYWSKRL